MVDRNKELEYKFKYKFVVRIFFLMGNILFSLEWEIRKEIFFEG